jgi:alkylhydroperoxidase/carboxymuconolactone decarboxylase family protein YurZ
MSSTDEEKQRIFEQIRERRGFLLPVHELMGEVDPEILRRYNELAGYLIFGEEPRGLDLKTRFLVMVGITTAVKGDREGIEWSMRRAMELGATEREVLEAALLAALPAGVPAVEYAARVWQEVQEGKGWVEMEDS